MKKIFAMIVAALLAITFVPADSFAANVHGYKRKDGTYVKGYNRKAPHKPGQYSQGHKPYKKNYDAKKGYGKKRPGSSSREAHVRGYTKKDGTYVRPHTRKVTGGKHANSPRKGQQHRQRR